jgi:signal transduction histidine kinase
MSEIVPAPDLPSHTLTSEYLAPMRADTGVVGETALRHAYDLGRAALAQHQSLLDIVVMHHEALEQALTCEACRVERTRTLRAGGELLSELLSPFAMAQGAFLEANAALRSANDLLEHEAQRVARLLHDSAGQMVFAVQLALASLDRDLPEDLRPRLGEVSQLMSLLDHQLRQHAHELYPVMLEDLGLAAALGDFIENIRRGAGLNVVFRCTLDRRLPRELESPFYRAVQQAFANILKHAHATEVTVTIGIVRGVVACSIVDNGIGFAARPDGHAGPGLGLVGIRERMKAINGTVRVTSTPGHGTKIMLGAPLPGRKETSGVKRHSGRRPRARTAGAPKPARS